MAEINHPIKGGSWAEIQTGLLRMAIWALIYIGDCIRDLKRKI
jgi:hypothetical protein